MRYIWVIAALWWAAPALAQPMWELSDRWACTLERHMRAPSSVDVVEMDPSGRNYYIDFKAMRVSSAFVDGTAEIVHRSYHTTDSSDFNIIVNAWPFGDYPSVFIEQGGVAWSIGGSGTLNEGDDVWVAIYRCVQDRPAG